MLTADLDRPRRAGKAIPHQAEAPKPKKLHTKAYADNFAYHRQR